jgi:hypothetical protein
VKDALKHACKKLIFRENEKRKNKGFGMPLLENNLKPVTQSSRKVHSAFFCSR